MNNFSEWNLTCPVKIEAKVEAEDFEWTDGWQTRGNAEAYLIPFHSFI